MPAVARQLLAPLGMLPAANLRRLATADRAQDQSLRRPLGVGSWHNSRERNSAPARLSSRLRVGSMVFIMAAI